MAKGKLRAVSIRGLRTIADLELSFDGLTVLVGDNGSGKSSILEALELARRLGHGDFLASLNSVHGGIANLLRRGTDLLSLTVDVEWAPQGRLPLHARYTLVLAASGATGEMFRLTDGDVPADFLFERNGSEARVWNGQELVAWPGEATRFRSELLLNELRGGLTPHPVIGAMCDILAAIEVHLPFEVTPSWAARAHQRPSAARGLVLLEPAERLAVFGSNLANAFFTLRNEHGREHWDETMDLVRIGLGGQVESVNTRADPGGGSVALTLKLAGSDTLLPARALSDGQLAYLCFVAMVRLNAGRSLLAFDEPELHMHPELLVRVVQLFEDLARSHPVILATHSDVLLDALSEPAKAVQVCELHDGATRLRRLDEPGLRQWMERYRGVGQLRSEGHLAALLAEPEAQRQDPT